MRALLWLEFGVGIGSNFGGYILEMIVGRSVIQQMLYTWD